MMKKGVLLALKIVGGVVAAVVILVVGVIGLFHTDMVQERLLREAEQLLCEHLKTHVTIGSVQVSLFGQDVEIRDVGIEDLQHRKMLQVKQLGVEVDLWHLLNNELYITEAKLQGLDARIYKVRRDTAANYQFVLDAFKTHKKNAPVADSLRQAADTTKHRHKLTLDVGKLTLSNIKVSYNDTLQAQLGNFFYKTSRQGRKIGEVREVTTSFVQRTKRGPVDSRLRIGVIEFQEQKDRTLLNIDSLCFFTDNHKPRKNANKPKRGFFDAGHLDVVAKMNLRIDSLGKDTLLAALTNCQVVDRGSGLNVTDLHCKLNANKRAVVLGDVTVKIPNTTITFAEGRVVLPSKKEGRQLSYRTTLIKGKTLLKDIHKPFAPVLHKFNEPLEFQTLMSGDGEGMQFRNVTVQTADRQLRVGASGFITGLKDKYKLHVHFDVHYMVTTGRKAEHIINQFAVRKFMMKQLNNLGRLSYKGNFDVVYKKELFAGRLETTAGHLDFNFALDELNKYVYGSAGTDDLELGKVMEMPDIGKIVAQANFKFDISKPRTAKMRRVKGGKLPIGHVDAQVEEAKFKGITVRRLSVVMDSDGAVSEGKLETKGKRVDLLCSFSFTNTNEMKKTKIKPGIRFHKMSDEDKQKRDEEKAQKKQEKEQRKAEKAAAKAARKAEKAAEKAARKAEKERRKAEKAAAKAARKAAEEN